MHTYNTYGSMSICTRVYGAYGLHTVYTLQHCESMCIVHMSNIHMAYLAWSKRYVKNGIVTIGRSFLCGCIFLQANKSFNQNDNKWNKLKTNDGKATIDSFNSHYIGQICMQ